MNAVGIDVSKGKSTVAILRPMGEIVQTPMELSTGWSNTSTSQGSTAIRDAASNCEPKNGNYGINLWLSNSATDANYAETSHDAIYLKGGVAYTFSAYIKVSSGFTWGTNGQLILRIVGSDTDESFSQAVLDKAPSAAVENGWQRVQMTFTLASGGSYLPCIQLQGCKGIAYVDDVQLEQAEAASVYNLVQNGSFENGSTHWSWGAQSTVGAYGATNFGTNALRATALYNGLARAQQEIKLNCSAKTTFQLSGWAKGQSAPNPSADFGDTERFFGLALRIDYDDEEHTKEFHSVPFVWSNNDWQCAAGNIVPKSPEKTIEKVIVFCAYDNNYGLAYFDNISLRQEPVQTYSYDEDGKLTSATQTGNEKDGREYNGVDLVKYTAPNDVIYEYAYNAKHQMTSVTSDNLKTTYTYNETNGRLTETKTQKSDGTGNYLSTTTVAVADDPNHTASVTDVNGATVSYTYNSNKELLASATNAKGTTNYTYVAANDRPLMTYQSGVAAISYSYDNGTLSSLTRKTFPAVNSQSAQWQRYSFETNDWGQQTAIKVSGSTDGSTWTSGTTLASYTYEPNGGDLSTMTYGNNHSVSYFYDDLDRLTKTVYNDTGRYIEYAYNAESVLAKLTYRNGDGTQIAAYVFEYDSLGRLIRSIEYGANNTTVVQRTEHLYDTYNRLYKQTWVIQGESFSESYVYNDPEKNYALKDGSLAQMTTATGDIIHYNYDGLKRLESTAIKNSSGTTLFRTGYGYKAGAATNQTTTRIGVYTTWNPDYTSIYSYRYEYDAVGNITQVKDAKNSNRVIAAYTYDVQNQLTQEIVYSYDDDGTATTTTYAYTYDTAGNILTESKDGTVTKTYTYGNSNWNDLLTEYNGKKIAYEGQTYSETTNRLGIVTSTSVAGTPTSGNPVSYYNGIRWALDWEQGRNLKQSYNFSTNSVAESTSKVDTETTLNYSYDLEGIRTSKTYVVQKYGYTTSSGSVVASVGENTLAPNATSYVRYRISETTVEHNYVTQNGKVIRETITDGATTKVLDFIYDATGRPFALKYKNGTADAQTYYYVLNLQGDVIALMTVDRTVVAEYTYNAWGEVLRATGEMASVNPLRYRGYYYDAETGFYYLQSRYYDPTMHRFINADCYTSTGTVILGHNMFAYCENNPIVYKDDCGESITLACYLCTCFGILIGHYVAKEKGYSISDIEYWEHLLMGGVAGYTVGIMADYALAYFSATAHTTATAAPTLAESWSRWQANNPMPTTSYGKGRLFENWFYETYNSVLTQVSVRGSRFDVIKDTTIVELKNYTWSNYSNVNTLISRFCGQAAKYLQYVGQTIAGKKITGIMFYFSSKPPQAVIDALEDLNVFVDWVR